MDRRPIFVKVEKYNEARDVVALIKKKIELARKVLGKIDELREQEDAEIDAWKSDIEDVEKKISAIQHSLTAPENG